MLVIRCTRKLLGRMGPVVADPPASTTTLGDWYANRFFVGHNPFVLLVSEKSLLAVLLPAQGVADIPEQFPDILADFLALLKIPGDAIAREVEECREVVTAPTANRSVLATVSYYAQSTQARAYAGFRIEPEAESVSLSTTPVGALGYEFPVDVTRRLFGLKPLSRSWFRWW